MQKLVYLLCLTSSVFLETVGGRPEGKSSDAFSNLEEIEDKPYKGIQKEVNRISM